MTIKLTPALILSIAFWVFVAFILIGPYLGLYEVNALGEYVDPHDWVR